MPDQSDAVQEIRLAGFDTRAALAWASAGRIEAWVHRYLLGGHWANPGLSDGLRLAPRWWHGPVELALEDLSPAVGPEPGMEYVVDAEQWQAQISALAESLTDPMDVPPLIAAYSDGQLSLRDGNTRYGAMRLLGWQTAWVIIWYNSRSDHRQHTALLGR